MEEKIFLRLFLPPGLIKPSSIILKEGFPIDIALHYEEAGEGFPLILLHGNGEDLHYFQRQIPVFSRKYRVIAVDTRGHGRSPRGTAPFTIDQFSEDLRCFMDQRGIQQAHLLGFSDGGNIALTFALNHPARIRSLILNGANLFPRGVRLSAQMPVYLGYGITALFAAGSPKARFKHELLGLMARQPHIDPAQLACLACPSLVIAGTRDLIKNRHTRLIARALPNASLAFVPGDHFIARGNAGAFNREILSFLEQNTR